MFILCIKQKKLLKKYSKDKFRISVPTWNDAFEVRDGPYSVSYILDYFEYILRKHGETIVNPSIRIMSIKSKAELLYRQKLLQEENAARKISQFLQLFLSQQYNFSKFAVL